MLCRYLLFHFFAFSQLTLRTMFSLVGGKVRKEEKGVCC